MKGHPLMILGGDRVLYKGFHEALIKMIQGVKYWGEGDTS